MPPPPPPSLLSLSSLLSLLITAVVTTVIILTTNITTTIALKNHKLATSSIPLEFKLEKLNFELAPLERRHLLAQQQDTSTDIRWGQRRLKRHSGATYTSAEHHQHNNPPTATGSSDKGYGPSILVSADAFDQSVEMHKSHVIECVHEAEPEANIKWYHNNEPIETDGHHHQALGSELVFLETKEHDEGIYHCTATNKFGSATSPTFSLTVIKPNKYTRKPTNSNGKTIPIGPTIATTPATNVQPRPAVRSDTSAHPFKIPTATSNSRTIAVGPGRDIVCEAPDGESIVWRVNNRQITVPPPIESLEATSRPLDSYNQHQDQASSLTTDQPTSQQAAITYRYSQRLGKPLAEGQREYILTVYMNTRDQRQPPEARSTKSNSNSNNLNDQIAISLNITCAYQSPTKGGYLEWIESDPSQLIMAPNQAIEISDSSISIDYDKASYNPNTTYRVPIDVDMAPPLDNLVNTSATFGSSNEMVHTRFNPSGLWPNDLFSSVQQQHFIPSILLPTLVIIILIMLVIFLLWRRHLTSQRHHHHHHHKGVQRSSHNQRNNQNQRHHTHKSYHRHYQVAPPTNHHHQYLTSYYPFAGATSGLAPPLPPLPTGHTDIVGSMQINDSFAKAPPHHRSHDLSATKPTKKTWSLFSSSKKHNQLMNPFLGLNPRQISSISKEGFPSLEGLSSGVHLLPGMLHSSLSHNNFNSSAAAFSTNYIDMRNVPLRGHNQQLSDLQPIVGNFPNGHNNNNNNQNHLVDQQSNMVYIDTPSDGLTSISPSSSSSQTNTMTNGGPPTNVSHKRQSSNHSGSGSNATNGINGRNQVLGIQARRFSNNLLDRCLDGKIIDSTEYNSDKNTNSSHHYSTIAEATSRCPPNHQQGQEEACYEDLDQHQSALGELFNHNQNQQPQFHHQPQQQTFNKTQAPNDSFRSRMSSFLVSQQQQQQQQQTNEGSQRQNSTSGCGNGISSSIRSSGFMSQFLGDQMNQQTSSMQTNNTGDSQTMITTTIERALDQQHQQQPSPYAVTSIRGVSPTPPPPPMSEAMKTLNEQFNLEQLILFNGQDRSDSNEQTRNKNNKMN